MSNQSGIVASQAVIDKFKAYTASHDRALLLKISDEAITIDEQLAGTSSFDADWQLVSQRLSETEPRYVFYRADDGSQIFISYVPDHAPVRSKMIYASTKTTLLRQLGTNDKIKRQLSVNSLEEVSLKGWKQLEASEKLAAPLTEAERSLKKITEDEADTLLFNQHGAVKKSLVRMDHLSNIKGNAVDDEVYEVAKSVESKGLVRIKIDESETVVLHGKSEGVNAHEVPGVILQVEGPQYVIYAAENGLKVFVYSCPSGSKIRERMVYAAAKQGVLKKLEVKGIVFDKVIEVGDPDEIEITELEITSPDLKSAGASSGESGIDTSSVVTPLKFNRPKPPRRK